MKHTQHILGYQGARLVLLSTGLLSLHAHAQQTGVPEVRIQAPPLESGQLQNTQPISVLKGEELNQARRATIGETLEATTPGVHSTGFGQGAGRPIIRGLDGPRVRVTENGSDTFDVSTVSPDHVVASNPLAAKSIEVIRGPATLVYGGNAIGGLVNIRTDLIPTSALKGSINTMQIQGASRGQQSFSFNTVGGKNGVNYSLSGFDRNAGDYRTPLGLQPNSFAKANGFSLGSSYVFDKGMIGLGLSTSNSRYGAVAETDITLEQRQRKIDFIAESFEPIQGVESLLLKHSNGRYRHEEIETTSKLVSTRFNQQGNDSRIELTHSPLGGVRGIVGLSVLNKRLDVDGEEAYLPSAKTKLTAIYYVAEKKFGDVKTEFGVRRENNQISPTQTPTRTYNLTSFGMGSNLPINKSWAAIFRVSKNERAPVVEELYANGAHGATGTYELGNSQLTKETSVNVDVGLHYNPTPQLKVQLTGYQNKFSNFIYGQNTDINADGVSDRTDNSGALSNSAANPNDGDLKRLAYQQTNALFRGFELEAQWRPTDSRWGIKGFVDVARGRLDFGSGGPTGTPPRMAPSRIGLTIDYGYGQASRTSNAWSGYMQLIRASGVSRVAAQETTTPGYTLLNAEIAYLLGSKATGSMFFLQGRNLLNQTARQHTSFLKDVAPMPGRAIFIGLRAQF
jgi:iron complex outermembrane recepter protein